MRTQHLPFSTITGFSTFRVAQNKTSKQISFQTRIRNNKTRKKNIYRLGSHRTQNKNKNNKTPNKMSYATCLTAPNTACMGLLPALENASVCMKKEKNLTSLRPQDSLHSVNGSHWIHVDILVYRLVEHTIAITYMYNKYTRPPYRYGHLHVPVWQTFLINTMPKIQN